MATNEKTTKARNDDRVLLRIDKRTEQEEDNQFVGLNGNNYLIPKNEAVMVPAAVKEEFDRGMAEKTKAISRKETMARKSEAMSKKFEGI